MSRRKKRPLRNSVAKKDERRSTANRKSAGLKAANESSEQIRPVITRAEDAVTVGWMLTTMVTFMTELCAYAGWAYLATTAPAAEKTNEFAALPNLLHFSAIVTGCLGLALAGVVYRVRSVVAPKPVTAIAIALCLFPIATHVIRAVR